VVIASAVLLLCTALVGCGGESLSVEMVSPQDGSHLSFELFKVSGTVSQAEAEVVVEGSGAWVREDGTFYAYVQLGEGDNSLEAVATLGGETARTAIECSSSGAIPFERTEGEKVVVAVGQEFEISLDVTLRLGHDWEAGYDRRMVALVDRSYENGPSTPQGIRRFRFRALEGGHTEITFALIHGGSGPIFELRVVSVEVS